MAIHAFLGGLKRPSITFHRHIPQHELLGDGASSWRFAGLLFGREVGGRRDLENLELLSTGHLQW